MIFSTFKGRFNFQGLFKKAVLIQVLFKPVRTLYSLKFHKNRSISYSIQEVFHVYLNILENAVTHLFLHILGNN